MTMLKHVGDANVRFGSKADLMQCSNACPLRANSGHGLRGDGYVAALDWLRALKYSNTNRRTEDERLLPLRSLSIWSMSTGIETRLLLAISCNAFQNSPSKVTEVSCPARLMERLIIGEDGWRRLLRSGVLVDENVDLVSMMMPPQAIACVARR